MRPLISPQQMAKIDQESMQSFGLSSWQLMNHVAEEMATRLKKEVPGLKAREVLVLCGPGNNGGDGYCLAHLLRKEAKKVFVDSVLPPSSEDCQRASKVCKANQYSDEKLKHPVVIDAIFGCFGKAKLTKELQKKVRYWNQRRALRVSLDVSTGVDTRSHRVHPDAFNAEICLCVAYPKDAFWREEVLERLGRVFYVGQKFVQPRRVNLWALEGTEFFAPSRSRKSHKSGRCLVVAGSSRAPGAAFLAAEAAQRVGCGYVQLLLAEASRLKIQMQNASFMYAQKLLKADEEKTSSLVLGPGGFPKNPSRFLKMRCSQVLDAEALRLYKPKTRKLLMRERILTPHPGEAARMLGVTLDVIQQDRMAALDELCRKTGESVYLKGAPGLLRFKEDQNSYVNLYTAPQLATAGSGDVLSGIFGGFLGRKELEFKQACFSALSFQRKLSEGLAQSEASLSSDQLKIFDWAFRELRDVDDTRN